MYTKFHGFSQKPFELLPNPRFLFLTANYREIIDSMMDGIRKRRGFVSITGEVGTGKTTLTRFLLSELIAEKKVKTVLIFYPTLTFKDLLKNILLELDLEVLNSGKEALLHQLNEYLTQMIPKNEVVVVIIDEAQVLSSEVMEDLIMLPKLATLQLFFFGQPEFEDKLNSQGMRQLSQRIEIKHQINRLNKKESVDYIDHRLQLVKSSSSEKFTSKAISLICSHAQGIPRIINTLCDNALVMGYSLSQTMIDVDIIHQVIKDNEGPGSPKTILSAIATALIEYSPLPIRLGLSPVRVFLAILSLILLGGTISLTQSYMQRSPSKTWDVEPPKSLHAATQPSSSPPFPQETREANLKGETPRASAISPEFPQAVGLIFASEPSSSELDRLKIVPVEEGESLSYLAQKYYGRTNTTLVTFLLDYNPEITNADLIQVNQRIKIPQITEELLIIQSADHTYKIHLGTFENTDFVKVYCCEATLEGKKIKIIPRKVSPKRTWYQVMVETFDHKDKCLKVVDSLKEKGLLPAFDGIFKTQ